MNRKKLTVTLFLIIGLLGDTLQLSAFSGYLNIAYITTKQTTVLMEDVEYRCDLNNDGLRESLKISTQKNKHFLYIDGKKVLTVTGKNIFFILFDLDKDDSYGEIYVKAYNTTAKSAFYRYNGKKFYKFASGLYGDGYFLKKRVKDNSYISYQFGDGTYISYASVKGFPASKGYDGYVPVILKFRAANKKMQFQMNTEHDIPFQYTQTASGTMVAYNKPSAKNVEKVFTLKKGDKYVFKKIKFSKPVSFIQIQNLKTKKTGWIAVNGRQMKIAFNKDLCKYFGYDCEHE